jgi:hypothetical protein
MSSCGNRAKVALPAQCSGTTPETTAGKQLNLVHIFWQQDGSTRSSFLFVLLSYLDQPVLLESAFQVYRGSANGFRSHVVDVKKLDPNHTHCRPEEIIPWKNS